MEKVKEETSIQFGKDVNLQEDSDGSKVLQSWTTFPVSKGDNIKISLLPAI